MSWAGLSSCLAAAHFGLGWDRLVGPIMLLAGSITYVEKKKKKNWRERENQKK